MSEPSFPAFTLYDKCSQRIIRPLRVKPSRLTRYEHHAEGWDALGHADLLVLRPRAIVVKSCIPTQTLRGQTWLPPKRWLSVRCGGLVWGGVGQDPKAPTACRSHRYSRAYRRARLPS